MLAATSSISTAAEDTETVIGGASVRYMGAEATIACCTAADACCLCAPQDRLRALLFESAHHPGLYPHVFFELRTDMCGSRPAGCVARSAGATRVRPAGVPRCVIFRRSHGHISGPHEALGLILGGSDTYG